MIITPASSHISFCCSAICPLWQGPICFTSGICSLLCYSAIASEAAPFGSIVQWLDADQMKENQREDECLLWLLVDRLADAADPEVYAQRAPQIARKLSLTFQQVDVEVRA